MRKPFAIVRDKRGSTVVEYGLIVALIFLTIAGSVRFFSDRTIGMFNKIASNVGAVT